MNGCEKFCKYLLHRTESFLTPVFTLIVNVKIGLMNSMEHEKLVTL